MQEFIVWAGVLLSLLGSHFITKVVEARLVKFNNKWLSMLVPLVVLVASFAAIAGAFIAISIYSAPNVGFSR